jgi:hypothetical protein
VLATITAGAVIGVVEVVLAVSFAALVYGGFQLSGRVFSSSRISPSVHPSRYSITR